MSKNSVLDDLLPADSHIPTNTLKHEISSDNPFSFQSFVCKKSDFNLYQREFDHVPKSPASPEDNFRLQSISATEGDNSVTSSESMHNSVDNPFSFKKFIQPQYSVPKSLVSENLTTIDITNSDNAHNSQNINFNTANGNLKFNSDNSELKKENFSLKCQIQDLQRKNISLSSKLQELQLKDSQETKELEEVIHNVEDNLNKANKRAILAESRLEELNWEFSRLKRQNDHSFREFYQEKTQAIGAKIRIAGIEAECLLNQMLAGVGNLRQFADLLESLHQVHEPIDSHLNFDK